jgi:DNA-binding response OmpR family regulator
VARVKAMLRRTDRAASPNKVYRLGDLAIDPARREVTVAGQPIDLRTKEFDCLLCLAEHKGFVLSREKLLELAWGYDFAGQTRTVDVHVAHLRKKISLHRESRPSRAWAGWSDKKRTQITQINDHFLFYLFCKS